MKIAFIGLGSMGLPMATNLLKAGGHDLIVYNRTRSRAEELARQGAKVAASPREAAAGVEVLITMLADDAAVESVMFGDQGALLGPLSPRTIGFLLFGALEVGVFLAVLRRPDSRTLVLGLAASVMAAFVALTTMHERYAYASVVFLALLLPERQTRWLWAVLSVTFTANLLAAIPPPLPWGAIPIGGPVGLIGSVAMLSVAARCLLLLAERSGDRRRHRPSS